ncbi:MAG: hypothetical protein QG636_696 [Patescibacteria group bacterium]|nr:hypothetical protein [Patescibacteria group bacterium]
MRMSLPPEVPVEDYVYKYLLGPVESAEALNQPVTEGNCRLALQLYYFRVHGIFFQQNDIYLPGGYKAWGEFIFKEEPIDFEKLQPGDVLYAQNFRGKRGQELLKGIENFKDKDEWLYHLHSAIYVGKISGTHYIWNATSIVGATITWPLETFVYYYKPISAKRIL